MQAIPPSPPAPAPSWLRRRRRRRFAARLRAKPESRALAAMGRLTLPCVVLARPLGKGFDSVRSFERLHEWSAWTSRHFRKGDRDVSSPETVREFSATGYVFGRRIAMDHHPNSAQPASLTQPQPMHQPDHRA